jgi:DNA-directed RNA polymerase subunit RPC12/RpoP
MDIQTNNHSLWQPPGNFQAIESSVIGVSVYAPRPDPVVTDTVTSYKCPQCGATTRFDVAEGGVACENCGYVAAKNSSQVGKSAAELEFTLETLQLAQQGWGTTRKLLHCDSCGADLSIPENSITVTCPFCASNKVNVRISPSDNFRPRFLIPFKIQPNETHQRAMDWMGKGWFHPKELTSNALLDRFTGVYLSFWTFSADILAAWKAEVGYERQESYYDPATKSRRTRTVIDWRWRDGQVSIHYPDLLIEGNQHISHKILERLYPFNLNDLVVYNPDFLAGWQALTYDISLTDAWERGKATMREKSKDSCYSDINSAHVRNFTMKADFADESWRYILLPIYITAYKFEEKVYQVMLNGQSGMVAGQKPVAWWKIWLAIALLVSPGLFTGLVGLPMLLAAGTGIILIFIGIILLIIGAIFSYKIYQKAVQSESA